MLYAAKCYWPGVNATELRHAAAAAGHEAADNLVLCVFEAPERDLVSDTTARATSPASA